MEQLVTINNDLLLQIQLLTKEKHPSGDGGEGGSSSEVLILKERVVLLEKMNNDLRIQIQNGIINNNNSKSVEVVDNSNCLVIGGIITPLYYSY